MEILKQYSMTCEDFTVQSELLMCPYVCWAASYISSDLFSEASTHIRQNIFYRGETLIFKQKTLFPPPFYNNCAYFIFQLYFCKSANRTTRATKLNLLYDSWRQTGSNMQVRHPNRSVSTLFLMLQKEKHDL